VIRGGARHKIVLLAKNNDVHAPMVLASIRRRISLAESLGREARTSLPEERFEERRSPLPAQWKMFSQLPHVSERQPRGGNRLIALAIDEFPRGVKCTLTEDEPARRPRPLLSATRRLHTHTMIVRMHNRRLLSIAARINCNTTELLDIGGLSDLKLARLRQLAGLRLSPLI